MNTSYYDENIIDLNDLRTQELFAGTDVSVATDTKGISNCVLNKFGLKEIQVIEILNSNRMKRM